ncbi:MAG: helix-turn-helix transcriptional regulator [Vicinamibacterales bacterium]
MKALHAERKERRFTQTELAALCGLSQGDISKFEQGRALPTMAQAVRLSKVLGLPVDGLLREVRDEPAEPVVVDGASRG